MKIISTILIAFLVFFIGGVILQIFLSKKNSKWFGLILPSLSFIYSLIVISNIIVSDSIGIRKIAGLIIPGFLITNIPTIVLLLIYFAYREKIRLSSELDKMNIQDLE